MAFYVCPGATSPCTVAVATADGTTLTPVPLAGTDGAAVANSTVYTPTGVGSYCFLALYSGDSHYAPSSDGATADQCLTVTNGVAAHGIVPAAPARNDGVGPGADHDGKHLDPRPHRRQL